MRLSAVWSPVAEVRKRALDVAGLLTEAYLEMIEGQYLDMAYEDRQEVGLQEYLAMISRKTGALIRYAMNIGAIIGTSDRQTVDSFPRGRSFTWLRIPDPRRRTRSLGRRGRDG